MKFSQFGREYSVKLTELPGMGHIEPVQKRVDANSPGQMRVEFRRNLTVLSE
ncbi:hypothetical protein JCM18909_1106 [Cutibacterium acnes JCM 18909]|nr:hypothetical protein JCM18909_1106 [Cutibacterium acnes JCM 18909]